MAEEDNQPKVAPPQPVESDEVKAQAPSGEPETADDAPMDDGTGDEALPEDEQIEDDGEFAEDDGEEAGFNELTPEELEEARANEVSFSWKASEYVHHKKGPGWYMVVFGAVAVLVVLCIWQQWWIQIGLVVMAGIALAVYAGKPPRTLLYELTPQGIQIEGKKYPFSELRSFSVYEDTEWHSIDLLPTRRFAPAITVLFNSDDLDEIVGHLELHLPRADQKPDYVDRLTRYLRF